MLRDRRWCSATAVSGVVVDGQRAGGRAPVAPLAGGYEMMPYVLREGFRQAVERAQAVVMAIVGHLPAAARAA